MFLPPYDDVIVVTEKLESCIVVGQAGEIDRHTGLESHPSLAGVH